MSEDESLSEAYWDNLHAYILKVESKNSIEMAKI